YGHHPFVLGLGAFNIMDVGLFVYTKIGLWKISINPKNYRTRITHSFFVYKKIVLNGQLW
ncbi:hypothetical protein, partial [uncultured Granulicatella sp.]|uniref:hypothetical protein n=1 Tax=uncultured Granulicatella sp. TaxID=316089 RepID=UPI002803DB5A